MKSRDAEVTEDLQYSPSEGLRRKFDEASKYAVILLAFSLPLPTAWLSISSALFLIFWIMGGHFGQKFQRISANPVAVAAVTLYLLFLIASLYSQADTDDVKEMLGKYSKLLFIPLIVSVLYELKWRTRALYAFLVAMGVALAMSYLQYLGLLETGPPGQEYTYFKTRISHNYFLAFSILVMFQLYMTHKVARPYLMIGMALALFNLFVLVNGRTGQVVFLVGTLYLMFNRWGIKGFWVGLLGVVLFVLTLYTTVPQFGERVDHAIAQFDYSVSEQNTEAVQKEESYKRLFMYARTLEVIKQNLLIGTGTGSFHHVYEKNHAGDGIVVSSNPHNEYLNITVQLGIPGLLLFALMLYAQWRSCRNLNPFWSGVGRVLVLSMMVGCLFNSFLMDRGEGGFFVILSAIVFSGIQARGDTSAEGC